MDKKLHEGHRQRVKTRYLTEGLDAFEDHQVLEMLLFYCIPMKDTNELAHNHPGGRLQPSQADIEVTRKISAALEPCYESQRMSA